MFGVLCAEVVHMLVYLGQVSYGVLLDGYVEAGSPTSALQLLQRLESSGPTPNRLMYNAVIKGLVNQNDDSSLGYISDILKRMAARGMPPAADTYTCIMGGLLKVSVHVM